jgi:hypothetical protein
LEKKLNRPDLNGSGHRKQQRSNSSLLLHRRGKTKTKRWRA